MNKKYFYFGLLGLFLFEILKVYFIMPMPGSQQMDSLPIAYFLFSWRWVFRLLFLLWIAGGIYSAFKWKHKWLPGILLALTLFIAWLFNFRMTADKMFLQPREVVMSPRNENKVDGERIVLTVENNGDARAYPVEFIAYHHQVRDIVGGKHIMVTYCSVCRTGRVFEPVVEGKDETFRLVGMDHFNAMFEDQTTKSWWRQENGEAVAGPLKGKILPEVPSRQMSIDKWLGLYPQGKIMQADPSSLDCYDSLARFEQGKGKSSLTGTDTASWKEKSWVVGICIGSNCKAYDWNDLKKSRFINDTIGSNRILLALSSDEKSFVAYEIEPEENFIVRNDTLISGKSTYDLSGKGINSDRNRLRPVSAYQEFWHSWRTFHPDTRR